MSDLFASPSPDLSALTANVAKLAAKDQDFARSLLDQHRRKGALSDKQMAWVRTLAQRATGTAPKQTEIKVGDVSGILGLFQTAAAHLKHPKIRLRTADSRPVCLSVAGPNAKRPGTINVTDGQAFGSSQFYGRVTTAGTWEVNPTFAGEASTSIAALLVALSADPAGVAAAYGKLTGNCCFCNTQLTDERSTDVGYGPVCAKKWGLAWGSK